MGNFGNVGMKKYLHMVVVGKRVERRQNLMLQLEHIIEFNSTRTWTNCGLL